MRRASTLTAAAAMSLVSLAAAQIQTTLAKPDAEFPEPFTRVASVRELPGGKVLVSDTQDKIVQMVDLTSGRATKIGREGQGPGEYALPATLFPLPGNQTWLYDLLGRRFLPIDPTGKIADPVPLPSVSGAGGPSLILIGRTQGYDAKGRIYFQAPPFNPSNPNAPPADSVAILRWDRTHPTMDTVAWIVGPKAQVVGGGGGRSFRMTVGAGKAFSPQEAWGVAPDGAVARVFPSPYRVVWYPPAGVPTVGPAVPYTPLRVTQADKDEVIAQRKRLGGAVVAFRNGGRTAPQNIQLPDPEFEETKPPFTGQSAVSVSPQGEVWVERTQPAGAKNPVYDVFDRSGRLTRKVTLNPRSRLVGFGPGTVFVVRQDEDELEYLQRFPWTGK